MYFKAIVAVTAGLLIGSTSVALGDQGTSGHCIALWPDFKNFHSLLPAPASVRAATQEDLTGLVGAIGAHFETVQGESTIIGEDPKQVFVFQTTGGRYILRVLDMKDVPGWYYGWQAPF